MESKILDLIECENYVELKKLLLDLNEQDIAEIVEEVNPKILIKIFRLLPKDMAADVFAYLPTEIEQDIIELMSDKDAGQLVELMSADDAADLFEEMPASMVAKILSNTTKETRKQINELLKYPEDSAGSIMTTEYLDFKEDMSVKQCLDKIRKEGEDKETIYNCFVLDKTRKLLGKIDIKDLLLANPDSSVKEIITEEDIFTNTLEDQENVAQMFKKYDLLSIGVVDSENRMVGIITIDDIVDIIDEEISEDMAKMAAVTPSDKPYLSLSIFEIWKKRIPWLLILMVSATFTSLIIQKYEAALAGMVILTSYIPMFMDTAGNAGSQSSVTIIRSLALNDIEFKDIFKVIFKELSVSILCGLSLAICNFGKLLLFDKVSVMIALVVCLTLFVTVVFAKIIGATLPILAKKIHLDPTVMASPFITTTVDAISLIIYFNIATLILNL